MNTHNLVEDMVWLTEPEKTKAHGYADEFENLFEECNVPRTLFTYLRASDIIAQCFYISRIEARLMEVSAPGPSTAKNAPTVESIVEAAGKARERLRKAMKEFEEYCANAGTPVDKGLAAIMRPILKKAEGVYEKVVQLDGAKKDHHGATAKRGTQAIETASIPGGPEASCDEE